MSCKSLGWKLIEKAHGLGFRYTRLIDQSNVQFIMIQDRAVILANSNELAHECARECPDAIIWALVGPGKGDDYTANLIFERLTARE